MTQRTSTHCLMNSHLHLIRIKLGRYWTVQWPLPHLLPSMVATPALVPLAVHLINSHIQGIHLLVRGAINLPLLLRGDILRHPLKEYTLKELTLPRDHTFLHLNQGPTRLLLVNLLLPDTASLAIPHSNLPLELALVSNLVPEVPPSSTHLPLETSTSNLVLGDSACPLETYLSRPTHTSLRSGHSLLIESDSRKSATNF